MIDGRNLTQEQKIFMLYGHLRWNSSLSSADAIGYRSFVAWDIMKGSGALEANKEKKKKFWTFNIAFPY